MVEDEIQARGAAAVHADIPCSDRAQIRAMQDCAAPSVVASIHSLAMGRVDTWFANAFAMLGE